MLQGQVSVTCLWGCATIASGAALHRWLCLRPILTAVLLQVLCLTAPEIQPSFVCWSAAPMLCAVLPLPVQKR